jgi:NTP pyrophosphatase (non-canonical NTP hydrolase)
VTQSPYSPPDAGTPEGSGSPVSIADYAAFVSETDLGRDKPQERFDIALYGLVGEIGSLVAAIKKRLLARGRTGWSIPNDAIIEELGDSLWYCFAIGAASELGVTFVERDVRLLQDEVGGEGERSEKIRAVLGPKADSFLQAAPSFLQKVTTGVATLEDFRRVAFLTSRTSDDQLVEVCLAVLQQLTAELLRRKLPAIEKTLNVSLPDRELTLILAEILWHLAALASLYGLNLSEVAAANMSKLKRRFRRGEPTPLPDQDRPADEQIPRQFDVVFVSVAKGRSRMYVGGRRLGDDLTDNSYRDDGYRFHDVMHLALAAKLGWSPVLRKLMGRKRRRDPQTDEVEDGARAAIVEEAVINAIYAEGVRVTALSAPGASQGPVRLFRDASDMSFAFLKRLESLVTGLEVERHNYWEWEDAILSGFDIFNKLRMHDRGTVSVDLEERSLKFSAAVFLDIQGQVAGIGTAREKLPAISETTRPQACEPKLSTTPDAATAAALGKALLIAIGLPPTAQDELHIEGWCDGIVDVHVTGQVRQVMWDKRVVTFRATSVEDDGGCCVTALALSDP